jgi:hypothetical protein
MYIINMSIKPSLLAQLTEYQEPTLLWNFLCQSFEVDNDSRKFDLKNRLSLIPFSKSARVENYFSQFRQNLAQLSAIGVKIDDADLVQIVMKALPDSYDYFLQNFTSSGRFPTLDQLQTRMMLEESRRQSKIEIKTTVDSEALFFRGAPQYRHNGQHNRSQGGNNFQRGQSSRSTSFQGNSNTFGNFHNR